MEAVRQHFFGLITEQEINEYLEQGSRVVWMKPVEGSNTFDVVLETYPASDIVPEAIVLDFLVNVDRVALDKKMLEGADLGTGVAESAIKALMDMVVPRAT